MILGPSSTRTRCVGLPRTSPSAGTRTRNGPGEVTIVSEAAASRIKFFGGGATNSVVYFLIVHPTGLKVGLEASGGSEEQEQTTARH